MTKRVKGELPVPPVVTEDPQAQEMIRAWISAKSLQCALNVGMWHGDMDETQAWGILLADLVRHVSHALEDELGIDHKVSAARIRECMLAELSAPTNEVKGRLVK